MFRVPDLAGAPCHCEACMVAGVSDKPVVRTPEGELHGLALRRWHEAREQFEREWQRAQFRMKGKAMPSVIVQRDPEDER